MAATGSDPHRLARRALSTHAGRLSLRLRLTIVYGVCFLLAATAVLGVTYGLIAHAITDQSRQLRARATQSQFTYTAGSRHGIATVEHIFLDGTEITTWTPAHPPAGATLGPASRPGASSAAAGQRRASVIVDHVNDALTTQRRRSLNSLLTWSIVALGAVASLCTVLGWRLAARALRSLRTMTSRARTIDAENLHERLAVTTQRDELGDLASTFDGVLARLEHAFAAQKRFVANASHELRTPVTVERVLLETALADPSSDVARLRHVCERVLASTEQQGRTIDALLVLARSQTGASADIEVDLSDLARDALALRGERLDGITVTADLRPAPLPGDPALLERLVANLLDNAIVHNVARAGWITVETGREGRSSWLRVSNSGPVVPGPVVSELFEPFRRAHGQRTTTSDTASNGLGLGLSIVRAIADVHRATVEIFPLHEGGLRVELRS